MKKFTQAFIVILTLLILAFGTWRAALIQSQTGFGDMRGRVVGARLVKDGKLPYYYIWYPGDPLKYFFNQMVDTPRAAPTVVSALTASPAFLQAIGPVAFYPEYKIDWGAFILFHLFFLISIALALKYAPKQYRPYVLLIMVPMILTDGWLGNFVTVQYYMLFGFLLLLIALLLLRKKEIIAGLLLAMLILLRPNTLVFALPFVALGFRYFKFLSSAFIGVAVYAVCTLFSPFQKSVWQQYFQSLKAHQAIHMSDSYEIPKHRIPALQFLPNPFEGVDYYKLDSLQQAHPIYVYPEASSFKSAYNSVLHHKPAAILLIGLLLISFGGVWGWLLLKYRKEEITDNNTMYKLLLAGMLFYFLSSFFSSITTSSYQFPQWWAVAAIFGIFYQRIPKGAYMLFLVGLVLNCYFLPGFRGKHFSSEICLLIATCWAVIAPAVSMDRSIDSTAFSNIHKDQ
jgi:hypothetical protein